MSQQLAAVWQDDAPEDQAHPEVVLTGRKVVVPEHFREHVVEKLSRLERLDARCHRVEVELAHEANPRQSKHRQRVQLTVLGKGPVVRAEAQAENFYAALELAGDKLMERLRRSKDRRQVHQGQHRPISVAEATANGYSVPVPAHGRLNGVQPAQEQWELELDKEPSGPGQVVRVKSHPATPMSVDDALNHMELVGHDFYLFQDEATGLPSVVYRRHGYDYGLIRLED